MGNVKGEELKTKEIKIKELKTREIKIKELKTKENKITKRQNNHKYARNFPERFLNFSVKVIKFLNNLPYKKEYEVFRYQLSKSATSIGANYEESQASSKKEFYHRIAICLREARETNYWLRIIDELDLGNKDKRIYLLKESKEITLMLGTIHYKHYKDLNK